MASGRDFENADFDSPPGWNSLANNDGLCAYVGAEHGPRDDLQRQSRHIRMYVASLTVAPLCGEAIGELHHDRAVRADPFATERRLD